VGNEKDIDISDDELMDEIMKTEYYIGIIVGTSKERRRILELLRVEASELLSHDGVCDCKARSEEVLRLITLVEVENE